MAAGCASPSLDTLASAQAHRPVTVRCVAHMAMEGDVKILWDGNQARPADYARIQSRDCRLVRRLLAARVFDPVSGYDEMYALDTLLHEATHMAGGPDWRVESIVECKALHATAGIVRQLHIAGFRLWWLRFEWQHQPPLFRSHPCPGFS